MFSSTNTLFYCKSCKGSSVEELGDAMLCSVCVLVGKNREQQPSGVDKAGKTGDPQDTIPSGANKAGKTGIPENPSLLDFDEGTEYCSTHEKHCFSDGRSSSTCVKATDPTAVCSVCFRGGAQHTCKKCTMDCHNEIRGCSTSVGEGESICTTCHGIINLLPFYTILVFILSLVCS